MEFLRIIEDRGYPADYLLARIHGRRLLLLSDWSKLLEYADISEFLISTHYARFINGRTVDGIWARYLKESEWIYYQMNNKLRKIFQPYFIYSELHTLLVCLRYKLDKDRGPEIERLLEFSLLSDTIKRILKTGTDIKSLLGALEKKSCLIPDKVMGLEGILLKDGFQKVEQVITNAVLEYTSGMETHPVIKHFIASIIDAKNFIALYKYLRWDISSDPVFIGGGGTGKSVLHDILNSYETEGLVQAVKKHTGVLIEDSSAAGVENAFLRALTKEIKKRERSSPDIGLILNYIWRCSVESKNLSIIFYGRKIDRRILKEELVINT